MENDFVGVKVSPVVEVVDVLISECVQDQLVHSDLDVFTVSVLTRV